MIGQNQFSQFFRTIIFFLKKAKVNYLLIGGVAVGVWGKPRLTEDVDFIVFISKGDIDGIQKIAKSLKLKLHAVKHPTLEKVFSYRIDVRMFHADFLIASTKFEQNALRRRVRVKIFDKNVYVPSKEDLLLLKVIPGRTIDLFDAENIAQRHKNKLDKRYLLKWAEVLSDEAEDFRIYKTMKKLLKS